MSGKAIFAAAGLVLAASDLHAGPLAPGATIGLSGTRFADDNELGGGIRWDNLIPFEIRNGAGDVFISGNLQDTVTVSNITGRLIISRNLRELSATSGTARIVSITATGFGGMDVTADYRPDGLGEIAPVSASRTAGSGDEIRFDFDAAGVAPPDSSRNCFAKTNANGFGLGATVTIRAKESAAGPEYSLVVPNVAEPQVLPTDRVVVTSLRQVSSSRMEIAWLSIASKNYDLYSAPSPDGPWTYRGDDYGSDNPRTFEFTISGGVLFQPHYFFRVDEKP